MSSPDLSPVLDLLEAGRSEGWHLGAQVYVSLGGEVLLDAAIGESAPGRALRVDDVMLWYSSGKPWTTVAILQLWEQGRLGLAGAVPVRPNLIREGNIQILASVIQGGKAEGMQAMDDTLFALATSGAIAGRDAYMKANDKARFEKFAPAD